MACFDVIFFLKNGKAFGRKVTECKMCVLIFSTNLSGIFLIPKRAQLDININVHRFSGKCLVIVVLWTSDWPVAEVSEKTTLIRDRHPCPPRRNSNPQFHHASDCRPTP
jgi:hypothetical protein